MPASERLIDGQAEAAGLVDQLSRGFLEAEE